MDIRRGKQLVAAAEAVNKMATIVAILPSRESHVRELLKIEHDGDRAKVNHRGKVARLTPSSSATAWHSRPIKSSF